MNSHDDSLEAQIRYYQDIENEKVEIKWAAESARDWEVSHPECPEHGPMWYAEGEIEEDPATGMGAYVTDCYFYCAKCDNTFTP